MQRQKEAALEPLDSKSVGSFLNHCLQIFLYTHGSGTDFDSLGVLTKLFNQMKAVIISVDLNKTLDENFSGAQLKKEVFDAVGKGINKYAYLVGCSDKTSEDAEISSWAYSLILLRKLSQEPLESVINVGAFTQTGHGQLSREIIEVANICKEDTQFTKSLLPFLSDRDLAMCYESDINWMEPFNFDALLKRFFRQVRSKSTESKYIKMGAKQLFEKAQLQASPVFDSETEKVLDDFLSWYKGIENQEKVEVANLLLKLVGICETPCIGEMILKKILRAVCAYDSPIVLTISIWQKLALSSQHTPEIFEAVTQKFRACITSSRNESKIIELFLEYGSESDPLNDIFFESAFKQLTSMLNSKGNWTFRGFFSKVKSIIVSGDDRTENMHKLVNKFVHKLLSSNNAKDSLMDLFQNEEKCNLLSMLADKVERAFETNLNSLADDIVDIYNDLFSGEMRIQLVKKHFFPPQSWTNIKQLAQKFSRIKEGLHLVSEESKHYENTIKAGIHHYEECLQAIKLLKAYIADQETMGVLCIIDDLSLPDEPEPSSVKIKHVQHGCKDLFKLEDYYMWEIIKWFVCMYDKSKIFQKLWLDEASSVFQDMHEEDEEPCTWPEYQELLKEVHDRLKTFLADWKEIKVAKVQDMFADIEVNNLKAEVEALGLNKAHDKIKYIKTCSNIKSSIETLENALECLGLAKKLPENLIEAMDLQSIQDNVLEDIDANVVNDLEDYFGDWTSSQRKALEAFSESRKLLDWVKANIHTQQELKTFMDLGSISAGESDIEVDRLLVIQTALNGFGPLFFDCNENSDFKDIRKAIEKTFDNISKEEKILDCLHDSNRLVDWIKDIGERHGSVESSSLTTVQQICEDGFFTVSLKSSEAQGYCNLEETIKLEFETKGKNEENSRLNYSELRELRSKLMLLSTTSEIKESVDNFVNILSQVEDIARNLLSLLQDGCHFFMSSELKCFFARKKKVKVMFNLGGDCGMIKCNESLQVGLELLNTFLVGATQDWKSSIDTLRMDYPCLNTYTTSQLIELSKSLALFAKNISLTEANVMLLRLVAPLANVKGLIQELKLNVGEVYTCERKVYVDYKDQEDSKKEPNTEAMRANQPVRKLIEDYDTDPKVAFASWIKNGAQEECDIEELYDICQDLEDDHDQVEKLITSQLSKLTPKETPTKPVIQDVNNNLGGTFEGLDSMWQIFIDETQDASIQHQACFMNLSIVAKILAALFKKFTLDYNRPFPKYLNAGKPNLILCSKRDIHRITLMLFQNGPEKPKPDVNEILICDKDTSAERLLLHCKRAFSDETGRIFVVLHSNLVSFEASLQVEQCIRDHGNSNFKLVFISDSKGADNSYLSTAFEKCSVVLPGLPSDDSLQDYINQKMTVQVKNCIDPESKQLRIVTSKECGNGKSLLVNDWSNRASAKQSNVHLDSNQISYPEVISGWMKEQDCESSSVYHLDATMADQGEKDDFLFSLGVVGCLNNGEPQVWVSFPQDMYMIEMTLTNQSKETPFHCLLPQISCISPSEVLEHDQAGFGFTQVENKLVHLVNKNAFRSAKIARPISYLKLFRKKSRSLETFQFCQENYVSDSIIEELEVLLHFCPVETPTWQELTSFTSFLNEQLIAMENSVFCNAALMGADFKGFTTLTLRFLIHMAQDFATKSVVISDESHSEGYCKPIIRDRRKWEQSPHPYIFFNLDNTLSFYGIHVDRNLGLVDERSKNLLEERIMSGQLYQSLRQNGVNFNVDFDNLSRQDKIAQLCRVIDVTPFDPNPRYELTYDNVMKMLAIFMRFRSNIPVVVMGETGCGKTSLIQYLSSLQRGGKQRQNLIVMKIHGGVTTKDIIKEVNRAIEVARENRRHGIHETILFFDEANTSQAINTIKTVICDQIIDGSPIPKDLGLRFIAAINPYKKHSDHMIEKLENAGLGYHINASETTQKLGSVPMRRLVYRVNEIPPSLFPFVWDFGSLDTQTEKKYISQMVKKWMSKFDVEGLEQNLANLLSACQEFMRTQNDECAFVSLRDVERTLTILGWFHKNSENIAEKLQYKSKFPKMDILYLNLLLAIGASYYVRLEKKRQEFDNMVSRLLGMGRDRLIQPALSICQEYFLEHMKLENTIAKNEALKENVWMMSICIQLNIPLFLVGKPGSSKSLAKMVVADAMQGLRSFGQLFKDMREIHMLSFQCSPIAEASGILGIFRQCQKFQKDKDLEKYSAVVVLDEVGLAEDSPKMPLKALHPLLEDGCIDGDDEVLPWKKVAFVGISNWALDPAKMNRGIFVSRGTPNPKDLETSANGICSSNTKAKGLMKTCIPKLTKGYTEVYETQEREYFGLRDFYSLIKMVLRGVDNQPPKESELINCIRRNFGGYFGNFDPVQTFLDGAGMKNESDEDFSSKDFIFDTITSSSKASRYILLLTRNNAALKILQSDLLSNAEKTHIMYGSSFPHDQEYASICYNINKIKIAMEVGHTVILCNLDNLYESLYDALNQNYVMLGGKRYVDLGLGTHRVKCRVHEDFKLILIAEDTEVYQKFPIPLINRMEKHFLGMETMLGSDQGALVSQILGDCNNMTKIRGEILMNKKIKQYELGDTFIGYHDDVIPDAIINFAGKSDDLKQSVMTQLLSNITPDAINRFTETELSESERTKITGTYFLTVKNSLKDYLKNRKSDEDRLVQITTPSRLLTNSDKSELATHLGLEEMSLLLLSLQQFETEKQFERHVRNFLTKKNLSDRIMILQSYIGFDEESVKLLESARFIVQEVIKSISSDYCILFLLHTPRVAGGIFKGLSIKPWKTYHIDELRGQEQVSIEKLMSSDVNTALNKGLIPVKDIVLNALPKAFSNCYIHPEKIQKKMTLLLENEEKLLPYFCEEVYQFFQKGWLNGRPLKDWLVTVALSSKHMKEGNTFQRSIWLELIDAAVKTVTKAIQVNYNYHIHLMATVLICCYFLGL